MNGSPRTSWIAAASSWLTGTLCLLMAATAAAGPAVKVSCTTEDGRLKVGQVGTVHVYGTIVPDLLEKTDQIFSWYVDLLNSDTNVIQINPETVQVPTSDRSAQSSSKGTLDKAGLHGVYDTFLKLPGAGHGDVVELFSVQFKAVGEGVATLRVGPGSGVSGLNTDFIVVPIDIGEPLLGGAYDAAVVEVATFVNAPPTLDALAPVSVDEGRQLQVQAVGHDPDPAQTLTYSLVGNVPAGAQIGAANGTLTWTPAENQGPGQYQITVQVADNGSPALTATQILAVTVNEANLAPSVVVPSAQTVAESTALSVTCRATDPDILNGQTPATNRFTFALVNPPSGAAIDPVTGVFSWTPNESQGPATYTITVTATDDGVPRLTGTNTFAVNVTEVNRVPTINAPAEQSVQELTTMSVAFSASDPDLPANQLSYVLVSAPPGVVLDAGTGVVTWTPSEAQGPGTYTITAAVRDNGTPSLSATNSFNVSVSEGNSPPSLTPISDKTIAELATLLVTNIATDADLPAQKLSFTLINPPTGAVINRTNGVFSWTPSEAQGPGTYTMVVRVADDGTPSATDTKSFDVVVTEANRAPVLTAPTDRTLAELSTLTASFTASDPDVPANQVSFSLLNAPVGVELDAGTGEVSWTPSEAQGPGVYRITVVATDNGVPPLSSTNSFQVTVNDVNSRPTIRPIADQTVEERSKLTVSATAVDTDLPAQSLTYSLINPPSGAAINPSTGEFTWTPTEVQGPGVYSIQVKVVDNDSSPLADTNVFQVTVTEVNQAPTLTGPGDRTVAELTTLTASFVASDFDLPTNIITFSVLSGPEGVAINPTTGVLTWTPTEQQGPGTYTISVVASDDGVPSLTATNTIRVTVSEANVAPVFVPVTDQTVAELASLNLNVTATDTDLPAQKLTYSLLNPPSGASIDPLTGAFSWTPTESQGPGTYNISVKVVDDAGSPLAATNTFKVTVTEVNTAPTLAGPGDRTVPELTTLTATHVATDSDVPANQITFRLASGPSGVQLDPATGSLSWTPTEAQGPGTYRITVVATDNGVPAMSSTNSFQVTVSDVNSAPTIRSIADQTVPELTKLTVSVVGVDTDVPVQTLTYSLLSAPSGATINPTTGEFTWTPTESQGPGDYTVQVKVVDSDASPLSATNSFRVIVTEANAAPVMGSVSSQTINELSPLNVTQSATDADLPKQQLVFSLVNPPAGATIQPATGEISWTPTEAQGPGSYDLVVVATDSGSPAQSATNKIHVTVNEVNTAPVLVMPETQSAKPLTLVAATVTASDADLPANHLTFSLVNPPAGAVIDPASGAFTWTPTEAQEAQNYEIKVRVTDDGQPALSATNSFTVEVGATEGGNPTPATLVPLGRDASGFRIQVNGEPNAKHTIQATVDMVQWVAIGTVTLNASGTAIFTDTRAGLGDVQIYRALAQGGGGGGVASPATLTPVGRNANGFVILLTGRPSSTHTIQATTDYQNWTSLGSVTLDASGTGTFVDTRAGAGDFQIYRALAQGGLAMQGPATLTPGLLDAQGFHISVSGGAGARYIIEYSLDLVQWASIGQVTIGANGQSSFVHAAAASQPFGFYRARNP